MKEPLANGEPDTRSVRKRLEVQLGIDDLKIELKNTKENRDWWERKGKDLMCDKAVMLNEIETYKIRIAKLLDLINEDIMPACPCEGGDEIAAEYVCHIHRDINNILEDTE